MTEPEDLAGEPVIDGIGQLIEFAGEEVIGAFDDDKAVVARPGCNESFDSFHGAKFVVAAVDKELGFAAVAQERKIGAVYGNAETNEVRDSGIFAANA